MQLTEPQGVFLVRFIAQSAVSLGTNDAHLRATVRALWDDSMERTSGFIPN